MWNIRIIVYVTRQKKLSEPLSRYFNTAVDKFQSEYTTTKKIASYFSIFIQKVKDYEHAIGKVGTMMPKTRGFE